MKFQILRFLQIATIARYLAPLPVTPPGKLFTFFINFFNLIYFLWLKTFGTWRSCNGKFFALCVFILKLRCVLQFNVHHLFFFLLAVIAVGINYRFRPNFSCLYFPLFSLYLSLSLSDFAFFTFGVCICSWQLLLTRFFLF